MKPWLSKSLMSLLLAGGTLSLAAQQNKQAEPAEKTEVTQAQPSETTPLGSVTEADTKSDTTTPPPEVAVDSAPFEYESTEKISEDLSVSYPVDI